MKSPPARDEQFLIAAKGNRTGVLLDLGTYERLREAEQELADIQAYDAAHNKAHAEVEAGQFETLAEFCARRKRKAK